MLQALRRNFGLKLFSLALALAGWAYFRFLAGPSIAAPFGERIAFGGDAQAVTQRSFQVSITYGGVNNAIVAAQTTVTPANVEVTAPAYAMAAIRTIRVDVPVPTEAGSYDAMVAPRIDAPGLDRSVFDLSPDYVRVHVDFVRTSS